MIHFLDSGRRKLQLGFHHPNFQQGTTGWPVSTRWYIFQNMMTWLGARIYWWLLLLHTTIFYTSKSYYYCGSFLSGGRLYEYSECLFPVGFWVFLWSCGQIKCTKYGRCCCCLHIKPFVLSTQRHQQYPQCPSWFFILERYKFCDHRQWDREKPNVATESR